jgi:hypothetical protein
MMVRFEKIDERSVVWSKASVSTSTAAVASSRTRMLEGVRRARARETSWRWPWERFDPRGLLVEMRRRERADRDGMGWDCGKDGVW